MSFSMTYKNKRFYPLMWSQFFGAFNDNILKNALVVMIAFRGVELWGLKSESLVTFATLIFILPFFLFSALAGQISDRWSKDKIIQRVKFAEILIMILAAVGFWTSSYGILLGALFLVGIQATFFGPAKYSVLPELVEEDQLLSGNAYVEVGTFIAILLGTLLGGVLISSESGPSYVLTLLLIISVVGFLFSLRMPKLSPADSGLKINYEPLRPTWKMIKESAKNKAVYNSILGISWFWFLGAVILSLLPTIIKALIFGNEQLVTLFLAVFTVGIAVGAILCEKLSHNHVEIGLVPFGSLGMSFFLLDLGRALQMWPPGAEGIGIESFFAQEGALRIVLNLFGIALSGGVFTVPLYTLIQQRSEARVRSRIIGANNIMNALFMVVGSGLLMVFLEMSLKIPYILWLYALMNLLVAGYIYSLVPEFTLRCLSLLKKTLRFFQRPLN